MTLRIHQYVYFSISSEELTAQEITARIGLEADRTRARGSRHTDPDIPRWHFWLLEAQDTSLSLDDQVRHLVARLLPHQDAIRDLVEEVVAAEGKDSGASLNVVRDFDHPDGVLDDGEFTLLGWHFDEDALRFLAHVHAVVDADEYGQGPPWYRDLRGRAEQLAWSGLAALRGLRSRISRPAS